MFSILINLFTLTLLSYPALSYGKNIDYDSVLNVNKGFSGVVLVGEGNLVKYHKAFGVANLEFKIPSTTDTKYFIGSLAKQYTAAAILKLEELGLIRITDKISDHMKSPSTWKDITIEQILMHTSGLANTAYIDPKKNQIAYNINYFIDHLKKRPLTHKPGEKWAYSNAGYIVLGNLIKLKTNLSFDEFRNKYLFVGLGINNTLEEVGISLFGKDSGSFTFPMIPKRASGYLIEDNVIKRGPMFYLDGSRSGAGRTLTTSSDFFKWFRGLISLKVLSKSHISELFSPRIKASITQTGMSDSYYAYGWFTSQYKGKDIIWHSGGSGDGNTSYFIYIKDLDLSVFAASNFHYLDKKSWDVRDIVHGILDKYLK